jgi:hypothetical protein
MKRQSRIAIPLNKYLKRRGYCERTALRCRRHLTHSFSSRSAIFDHSVKFTIVPMANHTGGRAGSGANHGKEA